MCEPLIDKNLIYRTLISVGLMVSATAHLPADAQQLQSSYEQSDLNSNSYRERLAELSDPLAEKWPIPRRDDQQVVYFLGNEGPGNTEFGDLRRRRAVNLLGHANLAAKAGDMAEAYRLFWQAAREDSRNTIVMRSLGIPSSGKIPVSIKTARTADRKLQWSAGSYLQVQSPHFFITARASREQMLGLALELERIYWIWTQVFFPLWENPLSIKKALAGEGRLEFRTTRHRVIVFPDRKNYIDTLSKETPGIEKSTGYYSFGAKITFLFLGDGSDQETRYHELTHQLIGEATRMKPSVDVGVHNDFWVVEGIATYMESLRFFDTFATVGGWESSRLQFARYRVRGLGSEIPLTRLASQGRNEVQQLAEISKWYSFSAAYSHLLMQPSHKAEFLQYIRNVYEKPRDSRAPPTVDLEKFLDVSNAEIQQLRPGSRLINLCLARTQVTSNALAKLTDQEELVWIDLASLPTEDASVAELISNNANVESLTLERTEIGDATLTAVAKLGRLRELDLTMTQTTDHHIASLSQLTGLEQLWLTATSISDASIDTIVGLPNLEQVDVQATKVTDAGIAKLRKMRPDIILNPLQIVTE